MDERGRLKLPAVFQQYLSELGEKKVFITTMDTVTARLYPISVWKANENLFTNAGEEADSAGVTNFFMNHYGADSDVDGQGRILLPQELRRDLGMENQAVFLGNDKGAIQVMGETAYQQRLSEAKAKIANAVAALNKKGLK